MLTPKALTAYPELDPAGVRLPESHALQTDVLFISVVLTFIRI